MLPDADGLALDEAEGPGVLLVDDDCEDCEPHFEDEAELLGEVLDAPEEVLD